MADPAGDVSYMTPEPSYLKRIAVKTGTRVTVLSTDEIDWIEAAGDYLRLHCQGTRYLLRRSLESILPTLDPREFVRVHRSHIVKISQIAHLTPITHGDFEVGLRNGSTVRMSRRYRGSVRQAMGFGF